MFRKNEAHKQDRLFSHYDDLDPRLKKRLQNTWAPVFYEHVFCQIDEEPFAKLYCPDNGRPNFPVNILLSLEFIKHWKDLTDEELLEQASFNYQVAYAIGLKDLGEEYIAPRTLYDFRERVYRYVLEHGKDGDLIFEQFTKLTNHFLQLTGAKTNEQRMDSTFVSPNIQKAGRLALAFDVLYHAVKSCPEAILSEKLKAVLDPSFKTNLLYKTKASGLQSRLEELLTLGHELLLLIHGNNDLASLPSIAILRRFISEQGIWSEEEQKWLAKETKDISADSLQSAHDPDATYRRKGNNAAVGYVLNLAETSDKDNTAQFVTDYTLEKNTTADVELIRDRIANIKERTDLNDLYVDGGYWSEATNQAAQNAGVTIHYSALTGRKPQENKFAFTEFKIENNERITFCPQNNQPIRSDFNAKNKTLSAHFALEVCQTCPQLDKCPVKLQKKDAVIRVSQKRLLADDARQKMQTEDQHETVSKRAAIEGTNSALKRRHGLDRLKVRGINKSRVVVGCKIIGHNFQQLLRALKRQAKKAAEVLTKVTAPQVPGCSLPI